MEKNYDRNTDDRVSKFQATVNVFLKYLQSFTASTVAFAGTVPCLVQDGRNFRLFFEHQMLIDE